MRSLINFSLIACFGMVSQAVSAQAMSGYSEPHDGKLTFHAPNGTVIVADSVTNTVYISTPDGYMREVSFQDAIYAVEPDSSKHYGLVTEFRNSILDPNNVFAFATPQEPYYPNPNPCEDNGSLPGGGEVPCEIGFSSIPGFSVMGGAGDSSLDEPKDLDTVYALRPEIIERDAGGSTSWTFYVGGDTGGYSNPGGSSFSAEIWAYDYNRWLKERSQSCQDVFVSRVAVIGSAFLVGASCTLTGVSAGAAIGACAGSILLWGVATSQLRSASQMCASSYPGPNNW